LQGLPGAAGKRYRPYCLSHQQAVLDLTDAGHGAGRFLVVGPGGAGGHLTVQGHGPIVRGDLDLRGVDDRVGGQAPNGRGRATSAILSISAAAIQRDLVRVV
jgi:hypothetical protein